MKKQVFYLWDYRKTEDDYIKYHVYPKADTHHLSCAKKNPTI